MTLVPFQLLLLASCVTAEPQCKADIEAWADEDGDGYGGAPLGFVCKIERAQADRPLDCDDLNSNLNPEIPEECDGLDNDCDGRVVEDSNLGQWWLDADGDGFGGTYPTQLVCGPPGPEWVRNSEDCDDDDPEVNPDAAEVCGGGDEDCDGYLDDDDDDTDPESFNVFWRDADGDGTGWRNTTVESCRLIPGYVANPYDCDDGDPSFTHVDLYDDADDDGFGDAGTGVIGCEATANRVTNDDDCDDSDPTVGAEADWFDDADGDGFGSGNPVGFGCTAPTPTSVQAAGDCEIDDPTIHPDAIDLCGDGIDSDCSGFDTCGTCQQLLDGDPSLPSGVYALEPIAGQPMVDVYCDMTTDGGGWTLVASTRNTTLDDAGTTAYYTDLTTLTPAAGHSSVWAGMRDMVALSSSNGRSDIRFACKINASSANFDVDLSFYDNGWYTEITTGTDAQSCFNDNNGAGADPPPARTNNRTGAFLPAGDQWGAGYLEGEDSCSDTGDFTVDFDDRGMDNNQTDGTDWGEDDSSLKCGTSSAGQAWFIFVREL